MLRPLEALNKNMKPLLGAMLIALLTTACSEQKPESRYVVVGSEESYSLEAEANHVSCATSFAKQLKDAGQLAISRTLVKLAMASNSAALFKVKAAAQDLYLAERTLKFETERLGTASDGLYKSIQKAMPNYKADIVNNTKKLTKLAADYDDSELIQARAEKRKALAASVASLKRHTKCVNTYLAKKNIVLIAPLEPN